jgi:hypothetical protein
MWCARVCLVTLNGGLGYDGSVVHYPVVGLD